IPGTQGEYTHTYDVNLEALLTDTDGSESLSGLTISTKTGDLDWGSAHFEYNDQELGTKTSDGWMFTHQDLVDAGLVDTNGNYNLDGVQLVVEGTSSQAPTFTLEATATSTEQLGDSASTTAEAAVDGYNAVEATSGKDTVD